LPNQQTAKTFEQIIFPKVHTYIIVMITVENHKKLVHTNITTSTTRKKN